MTFLKALAFDELLYNEYMSLLCTFFFLTGEYNILKATVFYINKNIHMFNLQGNTEILQGTSYLILKLSHLWESSTVFTRACHKTEVKLPWHRKSVRLLMTDNNGYRSEAGACPADEFEWIS